MTDARSLALFYVADGQRLEIQSWLLAASLARAHAGDARVCQFAYVSAAHRPEIRDVSHAIYEACEVELRTLDAPPAWKSPYPHGNKMVAACDARGTSHAIFLDTDMACTGSLAEFMDLAPDTVAAAPEGRPTWGGKNARWARAYAHFGLSVPQERVRLLRGAKMEYVPYFNAGFVAFPEAMHPEDGLRFAEHWRDTAVDFDNNCAIAQKRPWLDQITLPLTMARFGYKARVLGELHNYSLSHRADYERTPPDTVILHYHRQRFLAQAPQWPGLREMLLDSVPVAFADVVRDYVATVEATVDERSDAASQAAD